MASNSQQKSLQPETHILERIHQTMGDVIRTFRLSDDQDINEDDPFTGVLSAATFATRATVHATLDATPSQLVFGCDLISGTKFANTANWAKIKTENRNSLIMTVETSVWMF